MRYTPFLDHLGIELKADVFSDLAANIIDAALAAISSRVKWGTHQGRRRKPCTGQPVLLAGQPMGLYHCDGCGAMQLAGLAHMDVEDDYEAAYGADWPAGYHEQKPKDAAVLTPEDALAELCRLLDCADHGWAYVIGQIQGRLETAELLKSLAATTTPVVP